MFQYETLRVIIKSLYVLHSAFLITLRSQIFIEENSMLQ